jgi:Glyoxalase-like domain
VIHPPANAERCGAPRLAIRSGALYERAVPGTLDHLLFGSHDLDSAVADLYERSGVEAVFGGHHPELGTQNALARLGERRFLEVIAPAPALPASGLARELAKQAEPGLVMWAARTNDAAALAARAKAVGLTTTVVEGHRARPGRRDRPVDERVRRGTRRRDARAVLHRVGG